MSHIIIPDGYHPLLSQYDTQKAIGVIKRQLHRRRSFSPSPSGSAWRSVITGSVSEKDFTPT